jgi:peptidoglycan/LPS O-acetylase OafA/YrhL
MIFDVRSERSRSVSAQKESVIGFDIGRPVAAAKSRYIPQLDGLRAVSILLVLAAHLNWLSGGAIGVDIFFVISGYLITSILAREFCRTGKIDIKSFYVRRILRIVPAFAVLLAACAIAVALAVAPERRAEHYIALLYAATYTMNLARAFGQGSGIVGHTWSLAVEEQFYLVWPLMLCVLLALPRSKQLSVAVVLVIIPTAWRAWLAFQPDAQDRIFFGSDTRAVELFVGCLLALLPMKALARVARRTWLAPAALLAGLAIAGTPMWLQPIDTLVIALSAAWLIAAIQDDERSTLCLILGASVCVVIGRLSYSIYLWQFPIIVVLGGRGLVPTTMLPVAAILLSLAAAGASYLLIERPFLRLKGRFSAETAR